MAHYTLTIQTEDSDEFAAIAARLSGTPAAPAAAPANEAPVAAKPARAAKAKAEEPVQEQVGQPEPPVQPTTVDPAVLAAQNSAQGAKETAAQQPAASSDEAVTLDDLKALMTKALNANSAKTCQDAVRAAANGAPGLSAVAVEHYAAVRDALLPLVG